MSIIDFFKTGKRRCEKCQGFLTKSATAISAWRETDPCDGNLHPIELPYDDGLVKVFGEQYQDKTYIVHETQCGEARKHYWHQVVIKSGIIEYRVCKKCGAENKEKVVKQDYADDV